MKVLVLGGTRFFGKHLVRHLLLNGHDVTIATRGNASDNFSDSVKRLIIERTDPQNLKQVLSGKHFDVIYDNLAYCSNDVKYILDIADCSRYIMTSSTAVYEKHIDTKEEEFDPLKKELIWCSRGEFPYDEGKRQAECALFAKYPHFNKTAVRFPFVIGKDDYTNRLLFYVDHIVNQIPMYIDDLENQMAFVRSDEAGAFLAFLADKDQYEKINGSSEQIMSIKDIAEYVKEKTGKEIILSADGDPAPYNGENEYSINIDKAKSLGFKFTLLKDWIYDLLDYYIEISKR